MVRRFGIVIVHRRFGLLVGLGVAVTIEFRLMQQPGTGVRGQESGVRGQGQPVSIRALTPLRSALHPPAAPTVARPGG
jgi:hypothetical protein